MDDEQKSKQQYIQSAITSSKALAEGDHRLANKQAKIQNRIFQKIERGILDKNILVDLLDHHNIGVSGIAAIDLLRINYEVEKAQKTLERIVTINQTGMTTEEKLRKLAAEIQLKNWKEKGHVT
jgi:hypothetical protein